jgi:hypothetical protein
MNLSFSSFSSLCREEHGVKVPGCRDAQVNQQGIHRGAAGRDLLQRRPPEPDRAGGLRARLWLLRLLTPRPGTLQTKNRIKKRDRPWQQKGCNTHRGEKKKRGKANLRISYFFLPHPIFFFTFLFLFGFFSFLFLSSLFTPCFGPRAQVIDKLGNIAKTDMVRKSSGFMGLMKDKTESDVARIKATLMLCYGFVTLYAQHNMETERMT